MPFREPVTNWFLCWENGFSVSVSKMPDRCLWVRQLSAVPGGEGEAEAGDDENDENDYDTGEIDGVEIQSTSSCIRILPGYTQYVYKGKQNIPHPAYSKLKYNV